VKSDAFDWIQMLKFVLKRLANGVLMLFAVSFLAYFLMYLGSGNVARLILGLQATAADVAAKNHELGLDRPFFEQYITWLSGAIRLDLGTAWSMPDSVANILFPRLAITLQIVAMTTVIAALVAIVIGTMAAIFGGWIDRVVGFILGSCFWVAGVVVGSTESFNLLAYLVLRFLAS
jgi:peptide/nickel transport system permease protein